MTTTTVASVGHRATKLKHRYLQHISCTSYCNYSGEEGCCNQYTKREDIHEGVKIDNFAEERECLDDGPTDPDPM